MLASTALNITPEILAKEPVVIAIDDTTIAKLGKKFADVQYLYDHSIHDSKNRMVNGHCFVSLTVSVPVLESRKGHQQHIRYLCPNCQKFRYHHGVLGSYGLESKLCSIKVVKY